MAIGVAMGMLTGMVLFGDHQDDLPMESLLVAMGTIVTLLGVGIGLTGVTRLRLEWFGIALMVYAATRGLSFAIRTAGRTTGIGEWLDGSSPTWVWAIVFVQGFLVWVRAHREPTREDL
jgi:hypothetical protein